MESDAASVYHSLSESQTEDDVDFPREYTIVMSRVGDTEPVYPLAVEPLCEHGVVEIGWPGHLA
eukprot:11066976-Lingulodinium_polyedra.AAC.1